MIKLIFGIIKILKDLRRLMNGNKPPIYRQIPIQWKSILRHRVQFYNRLDADRKKILRIGFNIFLHPFGLSELKLR